MHTAAPEGRGLICSPIQVQQAIEEKEWKREKDSTQKEIEQHEAWLSDGHALAEPKGWKLDTCVHCSSHLLHTIGSDLKLYFSMPE